MSSIFIDANILIYFSSSDAVLKNKTLKFLQQLAISKEHGVINAFVLNEAHYVLSKSFGVKAASNSLEKIIKEKYNIHFVETTYTFEDVLNCFEISQKYNLKITDAYHAYFCKKNKIKKIATFDKHFDKLSWLSVVTK